eukprot:COSAG01_NODE_6242_length_3773_cov_2.261840_1_plen_883_part_00
MQAKRPPPADVDTTARRPGPPAERAARQIRLKAARGSGYRASLAMAGADMSVLSADAAADAIRAAAQASHECDLSYRKIGVDTARAVAAAAQAAALVKLSVYRAGLKDEAVAAMMPQLGRSATLQHLDLSYNVIGDAGAAAVAAALRQNDALLSLMMHQNVVGDSGALALAEAMRDNTVLQTLSLTHNKIGAAGAQAILSTMEDDNFTLTSINLGQNNHAGDVSQRGGKNEMLVLQQIAEACQRNRDPPLTASAVLRRRRRRLAATRAARELERERLLAAARANGTPCDDGAGSMAAKIAALLTMPTTPKPKPKLPPEVQPGTPVDEAAWCQLPPWLGRVMVRGVWRSAEVPCEGGGAVGYELHLQAATSLGHLASTARADGRAGPPGPGGSAASAEAEAAEGRRGGTQLSGHGTELTVGDDGRGAWRRLFAIRGGEWSPSNGQLELRLCFRGSRLKDRGSTVEPSRGGDGMPESVEEEEEEEIWRGRFLGAAEMRLQCVAGSPQNPRPTRRAPITLRREMGTVTPPPPPQPASADLVERGISERPCTPTKAQTRRRLEQLRRQSQRRRPPSPPVSGDLLPVLPTPRTYPQLVSELVAALPRHVEAWARSHPAEAGETLTQAPLPDGIFRLDAAAARDRSRGASDSVQLSVGGRREHMKINGGAIVVRSGGGWLSLEEWLRRNAASLSRRWLREAAALVRPRAHASPAIRKPAPPPWWRRGRGGAAGGRRQQQQQRAGAETGEADANEQSGAAAAGPSTAVRHATLCQPTLPNHRWPVRVPAAAAGVPCVLRLQRWRCIAVTCARTACCVMSLCSSRVVRCRAASTACHRSQRVGKSCTGATTTGSRSCNGCNGSTTPSRCCGGGLGWAGLVRRGKKYARSR